MTTTSAIPMLPRPAVYTGLVVGVLAVSTSSILAVYIIGDPPVVRMAIAVAFWRCLGGAVALVPFALRARTRHPVSPRAVRLMIVSGVFLAAHFAMYLGSLAFTTVASSTTLVTMSPIFVALGGIRFLGERPARRTWYGMAVTMAGAVALGLADATEIALGPRALLGDVIAFGGAVAITVYILIGRLSRSQVHLSTYGSIVYGTAAVVLAVVCVATSTPLWGYSTTQWLAIGGMILGPQLLGHTVFNTLMSTIPATHVSIAVLAEPVFATIMAWFLLGQLPATLFFVTAPLVLAGVGIATVRPRLRRAPDTHPAH